MADSSHDKSLRDAAERCLKELCTQFPMGYVPGLVWRRYRVTAGLAYYRKGVIGLSTRVLKDEQAVIDTLTHEYAHLLAIARHGLRAAGHGSGWQNAMRDLGQEAKVRHTYQVERNVARQVVTYQCVRCGLEVQRARRLPRRRKYVHANCGGGLKLVKVERVTVVQCDA